MPSRIWLFLGTALFSWIGIGVALGTPEEDPAPGFGVPFAMAFGLIALRAVLLPAVRVVREEVRIYHPMALRKRVRLEDIVAVGVAESSGAVLPIVLPYLALTRNLESGLPDRVPIMMGASYPTPWGVRAVHRRARKWADQIGVPLKLDD